jgi:hypothetical protein
MKVGISQVDLDPPLGMPMQGNFRTDWSARGTHDPLRAKAIVFDDGSHRAAMLTVDICKLPGHRVEQIRRYAAEAADIRGEDILVAATHTHAGPAVAKFPHMPEPDESAVEGILRRAAGAIPAACEDLRESEIRIGRSREDRVSFNRRLKMPDGTIAMNWTRPEPDTVVGPAGPIDPELDVMGVYRDGSLAAAVVNFALHPAILAGDNWLYSADYPGALAEALGRITDPDTPPVTLFFNGPCGNVNHIDYRDPTQGRGFKMVQRVGYMLAVAAREALDAASPLPADAPVGSASRRVPLPRVRIDDDRIAWAHRVIEDSRTNPAPQQVDGLPDVHYAQMYLKMRDLQDRPDPVEVQALRVATAGVVAVPGELFCELGMDIRRDSPAEMTFLVEQANDAIGYLPTVASFDEGGYEPTPGSTNYVSDAGERLVRAGRELLGELFD